MTEIPFVAFAQYLWHESIQVDTVHFSLCSFFKVSEKSINEVLQLFSDNCSIKKWHEFKRDYNLQKNSSFKWLKLIYSIPEKWKFIIKENHENAANFIIHDHYFKWLKLIDSIPERWKLSKKTMKMLLILSFMTIT